MFPEKNNSYLENCFLKIPGANACREWGNNPQAFRYSLAPPFTHSVSFVDISP